MNIHIHTHVDMYVYIIYLLNFSCPKIIVSHFAEYIDVEFAHFSHFFRSSRYLINAHIYRMPYLIY